MKKVLVADDDQALRELYGNVLKQSGFGVLFANDGLSAIDTIITKKPELMILDIGMPNVDGFSVLEIIKKTPDEKNIKILVISARGDEESKKEAIELGADDYLAKSEMTMDLVVDRINKLLL